MKISLIFLCLLGLCYAALRSRSATRSGPTASLQGASRSSRLDPTTFSPVPLNSSTALPNPMSGFFNWLEGSARYRAPVVATESYGRFSWANLETSPGKYDFSRIDRDLAALPAGGRLSFRVMAVNSCYSPNGGVDVPRYLIRGKGWYAPLAGKGCSSNHVYLPDWNDPVFLTSLTNLLNALGARYDHDARINFIDIGIMGNWGEWHLDEFPYCNSTFNTASAQLPRTSTLQAIINAHVNAFPSKRLLMLTDDKVSLLYALKINRSLPIGMRRDSWGSLHFNNSDLVTKGTTSSPISVGGVCVYAHSALSAADQKLIFSRWRTAPFVAESYGGAKALEVGGAGVVGQIRGCHVAAINNGSWSIAWNSIAPIDQTALLNSGLASGFRLSVTEVDVQQKDANTLSLRSTWLNSGVAVPYDSWTVQFILYDQKLSAILSTTNSSLNLKTVLPNADFGTCMAPATTSIPASGAVVSKDLLSIAGVPSGNYELRVRVSDAGGYLAPMRLALASAPNEDGSYTLGRIRFQHLFRGRAASAAHSRWLFR